MTCLSVGAQWSSSGATAIGIVMAPYIRRRDQGVWFGGGSGGDVADDLRHAQRLRVSPFRSCQGRRRRSRRAYRGTAGREGQQESHEHVIRDIERYFSHDALRVIVRRDLAAQGGRARRDPTRSASSSTPLACCSFAVIGRRRGRRPFASLAEDNRLVGAHLGPLGLKRFRLYARKRRT
jgi:hypothetical protein